MWVRDRNPVPLTDFPYGLQKSPACVSVFTCTEWVIVCSSVTKLPRTLWSWMLASCPAAHACPCVNKRALAEGHFAILATYGEWSLETERVWLKTNKKMKSYRNYGFLKVTAKSFSRNESLEKLESLECKEKSERCSTLWTGFNYKFPTLESRKDPYPEIIPTATLSDS
jgi:hypothetical protein